MRVCACASFRWGPSLSLSCRIRCCQFHASSTLLRFYLAYLMFSAIAATSSWQVISGETCGVECPSAVDADSSCNVDSSWMNIQDVTDSGDTERDAPLPKRVRRQKAQQDVCDWTVVRDEDSDECNTATSDWTYVPDESTGTQTQPCNTEPTFVKPHKKMPVCDISLATLGGSLHRKHVPGAESGSTSTAFHKNGLDCNRITRALATGQQHAMCAHTHSN